MIVINSYDRKIVIELCNRIGKSSVVIIINKKQLFFKVKLELKHNNSL